MRFLNEKSARDFLKNCNNVSNAALRFAKSGFVVAPIDILESRKSICLKCEFWNKEAFNNTGKCNKCGCSTWAKLRMLSEKCPIGKW